MFVRTIAAVPRLGVEPEGSHGLASDGGAIGMPRLEPSRLSWRGRNKEWRCVTTKIEVSPGVVTDRAGGRNMALIHVIACVLVTDFLSRDSRRAVVCSR